LLIIFNKVYVFLHVKKTALAEHSVTFMQLLIYKAILQYIH